MFTSFILLGFFLSPSEIRADEDEFSKSYSEEYDVDRDATLSVKNKFGEIVCQNWEKNVVSINVLVTVETGSSKKGQEYLDQIDVTISGTRNRVEAVTEFNKGGNFKNAEINIDYMIMMPPTLHLELENKFGEIVLDEAEGPASLDIAYGDLDVNSLMNKDNKIVIQFGEGNVGFISSADIKLSYSELDVEGANYLDIKSSFSDLTVEKSDGLTVDSQYDDVSIDKVGAVTIESKFSDVEIDSQDGKFFIDIQYGELSIDYVNQVTGKCEIYNSFGDVSFSINPDAAFYLDGEAKYGSISISVPEDNITHRESGYTTNIYEGTVGNSARSDDVLFIRSKNGSVHIK